MYRSVCVALGAALVSLTVAGCADDGPEIATVHGKVTMDGQPLPYASVIFFPEAGGRPAAASTDEDGNYELNFSGGRQGAIIGKNMVRISTIRDPSVSDDGTSIPGSGERVPMRYNAKTELEFVVEEGKTNVADWDLTSEGTILEASMEE